MKKVLGIIKKIIIGLLAVAFFGFAIAMTVLLLNFNDYGVTQIGDSSLLIIRSELSSSAYKKGDLVVVESKKIADVKIGDELFAYKVDTNGVVNIDLGVVGEIHQKEDAISYKNGGTYAMKFIVGKASKVYNNIGTYLSIIESKWGFLFIVLVPCFLIFVYQIYALVVELKYGKEDALASQ